MARIRNTASKFSSFPHLISFFLPRSLGIHWGTFKLTTEFYLEPRTLLTTFLEKNSIPAADFVTTDIGGSVQP
jgi:hypothetical protein